MNGTRERLRMAASHLTVSVDERTRLAQRRLGELVLDKWRLDRLIGIGGMAAVFQATHRNGNRVAIKILHPDLAESEEIRERFLAEGYVANRVAHPGVVTVRDEGTTSDGAVFLVMDLLRGQTVAERLEQQADPLSTSEVLEISSQLLDVLVHAHQRGIVHRDIKPENVFLTVDGRVRLLDFGIARIDNARGAHSIRAGSTLGTPAFMSPEQALGRWDELDGRSDLWSLGATMYLLLSGHPVREHGSATELLVSAMTRPVESLGAVKSLPRAVVAVVDRALAFDRAARYPDALSMQLAVRAAQDELSVPDSCTTLPPPSIEPMAVSLRTPGSERFKYPSVPTVRPVAATATPLPNASGKPPRSALPLYITFGFAVGISIVVAARLTVQPFTERHYAARPEQTEGTDAVPVPSSSSATPAAETSSAPPPPPASADATDSARRPRPRSRPRPQAKPPVNPPSRGNQP